MAHSFSIPSGVIVVQMGGNLVLIGSAYIRLEKQLTRRDNFSVHEVPILRTGSPLSFTRTVGGNPITTVRPWLANSLLMDGFFFTSSEMPRFTSALESFAAKIYT